jgi:hypothetical protein
LGSIGHQTGNWEWKFYKAQITGTQTSFGLAPILVTMSPNHWPKPLLAQAKNGDQQFWKLNIHAANG